MTVSDDQLGYWHKPAFGNEDDRAANTERLIRDAVNGHQLLSKLDIRVLAKGSFKNNTNVRRDSDIDVAVEFQGMIQLDYPDGANFSHTGLQPYTGPFLGSGLAIYKAAVGEAMREAFGSGAVNSTGNKVFTVRESTRSLAADIVPCVTHRMYWLNGIYVQGIELILNRPDGTRHYNYPDQQMANGVAKNLRTGKRYKQIVRIMKNIENHLVGIGELTQVPSYLIECLAYNVTDSTYNGHNTWREILKHVCAEIWAYLQETEPTMGRWLEVSECKWLFDTDQN